MKKKIEEDTDKKNTIRSGTLYTKQKKSKYEKHLAPYKKSRCFRTFIVDAEEYRTFTHINTSRVFFLTFRIYCVWSLIVYA